jgi:hypothetical protein
MTDEDRQISLAGKVLVDKIDAQPAAADRRGVRGGPAQPVDIFSNEDAVKTPLGINDIRCSQLEPLWLMAQSVPSASLVPCVHFLPVGWSVAEWPSTTAGR